MKLWLYLLAAFLRIIQVNLGKIRWLPNRNLLKYCAGMYSLCKCKYKLKKIKCTSYMKSDIYSLVSCLLEYVGVLTSQNNSPEFFLKMILIENHLLILPPKRTCFFLKGVKLTAVKRLSVEHPHVHKIEK